MVSPFAFLAKRRHFVFSYLVFKAKCDQIWCRGKTTPLSLVCRTLKLMTMASPPVDLPIPVKIGITLLSLQSPDESSLVSSFQTIPKSYFSPPSLWGLVCNLSSSQHYEVEFLLHQTWEDPRLGHLKDGEGRFIIDHLPVS